MSPFDINSQVITLTTECFQNAFELDTNRILRRDNVFLETYLTESIGRQLVRLRHHVYCGKPQVESHELSYPATWWDALKIAHPRLFSWCRWIKPARMTKITVQWEGKLAFPEIPLQNHHQSFVIWSKPTWDLMEE